MNRVPSCWGLSRVTLRLSCFRFFQPGALTWKLLVLMTLVPVGREGVGVGTGVDRGVGVAGGGEVPAEGIGVLGAGVDGTLATVATGLGLGLGEGRMKRSPIRTMAPTINKTSHPMIP